MSILKIPRFSEELELVPFDIKGKELYVKYFSDGVQAGFPSPADDFKEQKISLDSKYLINPDATYLVRVKGDSMYPTLQKGDLLIVKSDKELTDNKIGVMSFNNTDFTVKRCDKKNNVLIADNDSFPNIKVEEDDTILCLGIVQHFIRDL
ncbi:DNA polymerase V [Flaviramulus basaltis]|uniref:DNA polymerase V n=1 Tax=Flaviramulus basaltis TaxID=369401 RepID=A0A1K2IQE4_9FLAO|nr:S24 family peptidase [Flaviramulus basaltis]SFZ94424.1 DNA polymerase V [Flaviramulus basaltis]